MLVGMALYVRLLVYAGLSLFIISGLYVYMVVCVVYAYNLTLEEKHLIHFKNCRTFAHLHCCKPTVFYNVKPELKQEIKTIAFLKNIQNLYYFSKCYS